MSASQLSREEFAAAIKMYRERLSLTQAEAATLCRVSLRIWWQWEDGRGSTYPAMIGVLQILKGSRKK